MYLFYPASLYPHKNHCLLFSPSVLLELERLDVVVGLTIERSSGIFPDHPSLRYLGRMSRFQAIDHLRQSSALLFLSSFESLGLPLLEACLLQKPILAPDCLYVRELIGSSCYSFVLEQFEPSFMSALGALSADLMGGICIKPLLCQQPVSSDDWVRMVFEHSVVTNR
jgi:hypothetical protein